MAKDAAAAEAQLDPAIDAIMDCIDEEESRSKAASADRRVDRSSPLLVTLWARCAELLYVLADVKVRLKQ